MFWDETEKKAHTDIHQRVECTLQTQFRRCNIHITIYPSSTVASIHNQINLNHRTFFAGFFSPISLSVSLRARTPSTVLRLHFVSTLIEADPAKIKRIKTLFGLRYLIKRPITWYKYMAWRVRTFGNNNAKTYTQLSNRQNNKRRMKEREKENEYTSLMLS